MNFTEYWNALIKRNSDFASKDTIIKISVQNLKELLEQAHSQGHSCASAKDLKFENIFSGFGGK